MKTITMDFETYEKELDRAKAEGAKLTESFILSLDEAIETLSRSSIMSRNEFYSAIRKIINVRDGLK